jgi:hypothetical protein
MPTMLELFATGDDGGVCTPYNATEPVKPRLLSY